MSVGDGNSPPELEQQGPFKLKKLPAKLPPADVFDDPKKGMRYMIESDLEKREALNEIVDAVAWGNIATHKGFIKVNDRLNLINGRVGKSEEKIREFEGIKRAREDAAAKLAADLVRKNEEDRTYRAKVFGYLKWIVGLIAVFSGSPLFVNFVSWIWKTPAVLIGGVVTQALIIALFAGVYYGRKRSERINQ